MSSALKCVCLAIIHSVYSSLYNTVRIFTFGGWQEVFTCVWWFDFDCTTAEGQLRILYVTVLFTFKRKKTLNKVKFQ